jgi:hypothetical protein
VVVITGCHMHLYNISPLLPKYYIFIFIYFFYFVMVSIFYTLFQSSYKFNSIQRTLYYLLRRLEFESDHLTYSPLKVKFLITKLFDKNEIQFK